MNSHSKNPTVCVHWPCTTGNGIRFHMIHDDGTMSIDVSTERGTMFLNLSRETADRLIVEISTGINRLDELKPEVQMPVPTGPQLA